VHETCCILLSNPRFWWSDLCCKDRQQTPQAKHLLVLEQSIDLASVDQGLQDVITRQVPTHKLHALLWNLERLVREKLNLTLPMGLLTFHLAFRGWKVERVLTLHLLLSFSGSYLGVFWKFCKEIQGSSDGEGMIRRPERGEWMGADKSSSPKRAWPMSQIQNQGSPHEFAKVA
jgi:hypothetical protein